MFCYQCWIETRLRKERKGNLNLKTLGCCFSSLSGFLSFACETAFTSSFHLYNPYSLGASYAVVCPVMSKEQHTHTDSHTHSLGAPELYLAHAQLPQIKKSN